MKRKTFQLHCRASRNQSVLVSAALLPKNNAPGPFLGLNVNPGYDHIKREIMDEFVAHRPHPLMVMVGKYHPPPNTNMMAKTGSFNRAGEVSDGNARLAIAYAGQFYRNVS